MVIVWLLVIVAVLFGLSFGASRFLREDSEGLGAFALFIIALPYIKFMDSGFVRQAKFLMELPIVARRVDGQCYICKRQFGMLIHVECDSCGVEICTDHWPQIKRNNNKCPYCGGTFEYPSRR